MLHDESGDFRFGVMSSGKNIINDVGGILL